LPGRRPGLARGRPVAQLLRSKARSNANRARLVKDLPPAEIGDEAFANDVEQAVGKCLEAAIAWSGRTYPFTHDIGKLIALAEKAGLALTAIDRDVAESLTAFASAERYEVVRSGPPIDRRAMLEVMESIEIWVDRIMAA
jgi:HEPN domain-containing protein